MRFWLIGLLFAMPSAWADLVVPPEGASEACSPWHVGSTTRLRSCLTQAAQHDGSYGKTRFELAKMQGGVTTFEAEGQWRILGFHPEKRRYLLGGLFEQGAWVPLDAMEYLDEATGKRSAWRYKDADFIAFTAVAREDGRYVAFVSRLRGVSAFRVELLDTAEDLLYDVAAPPAPPPSDAHSSDACGDWRWNDEVHDGFEPLDAGIIRFTKDALEISYGKDSCKKRAAARTRKRWPIAAITRKPIPVPRAD